MFRTFATVAFLGMCAGNANALEIFTCVSEHDVPSNVAAELDKVLTRIADPVSAIAPVYGYAPGGVLSVNGANWRYARAIGTADAERETRLTCAMPFQIGSNTKMMIGVVLMQLQEEGALSLDDPLFRYLPEFAQELPNGDLITLRQLANHTAGVFSYTDNAPDGTPGIMEGDLVDPAALRHGYDMKELVQFAIDHGQPMFQPGAAGKWAYSNTGFVLLGLIIEKIDRRPLAQSFKTRIFDRLGMNETRYVEGIPGPELGLPRSYFAAPFDVETTEWNMSQGAAAGAVVSTADDMHLFIEALLGGRLFADKRTLAEMQVTVPTTNGTIPNYGIGLAEKADGVWGHGGQTLGFESDVAYFQGPSISMVGWATSANNIMTAGVNAVFGALVNAGVLPDPAIAETEELRWKVTGPEWRLVSVEVMGSDAVEIRNPEEYTITFASSGSFAAKADCKRVLGEWSIERLELAILPGSIKGVTCPPESLSESFVQWLTSANAAFFDSNETLVVFSGDSRKVVQMLFRQSK